MFKTIIAILFAALLTENISLVHFLGTGAVIENERGIKKSLLLGAGTIITLIFTTLIAWPLNNFVFNKLPYLQTLVLVIVVMLVAWVMHLIAKGRIEGYCDVDFVKFAINGAILGVCINSNTFAAGTPFLENLPYLNAIIGALAVGIAVTITMIIFSSLHEKIDEKAVPNAFRGLPISLLIAGLMALVFLCF